MSPNVAADFCSRAEPSNFGGLGGMNRGWAQVDVFAAFLQALNSPGDFRLIDRGGELFLEPAPGLRNL
jgi:hypothetical protein